MDKIIKLGTCALCGHPVFGFTDNKRPPMHDGCFQIRSESMKEILTLRGLINGAYDIVELWKAETPSQQKWRAEWMAQARRNGAVPSP